ncbi:hypothetical protein F2Q69_00028570 [Brassica cretica]|uniref:Uncharacterized protein n=1 Tax=Brassica cretica TaxID=69181 RepID=A0A8S9S648_BRACR|nr:hypothetical protein F2Q69_00028570 [Brassica cretica]
MEDSSVAIQSLQGDLLRLCEEKNNALAMEKEIKALRLKVKAQDEAGKMAASENEALRKELEGREEDVVELKLAKETFGAEKMIPLKLS